jgi:hypothetical protein
MGARAGNSRWQILIASSVALEMHWCSAASAATSETANPQSIEVSGSGTDLLNAAIVHAKTETAQGTIQKSTEVVELNGDLTGKVLYQVTSTFDYAKGTLVNTGNQVFSGTIAGSDPVLLLDSKFRFEVNLKTGEDSGDVFLLGHLAGPDVTCTLHVVGTGKDADGNPLFRYTGICTFSPNRPPAPRTK